MYARAAAATTAALVGTCALLLPAQHPTGGAPRPVVVAHRGASGHAPENTLEAVDQAARLGVEWVENDVQRTRDGELVVIHDSDLRRTTDVEDVFPGRAPWAVGDFTAAEIARLDAGAWKDARYAGTRIPTLQEYLGRVESHRQRLLLEIKSPELYPGIEKEILDVLDGRHWLDAGHVAHRLVIQSFSADSVRAVHALRPDVKTGFLGAPPVGELPAYAAFADQINPDETTLSADYVKSVHALRGAHGAPLEVYAWTVDGTAAVRRVAGYGVDGVITNYPDTAVSALGGQTAICPS
ncbi:glycerophosphodiester phosphodiesterase family protein [Streptomyces sp. TS71-3]|uniref:glycerophosphodiester phosphodiesterase n=1 Tax=Streptomyces sp. TS71-3 TaxID=2733862 RepID=UPI001B0868E2|nr:glycerophosphodiester phosphodiesterase family protein [Streptomyces sp. TS71-3]GHJ38331.1 hydrolase [Streptomyces sp. TS71-3]